MARLTFKCLQGDMVRGPAGSLYTVMTIRAAGDNAVVTELSRKPAEVGMAIGAAVMHGNMVRRLTRCLHVVVTINTGTKNLGVIHTAYILPQGRRMAGIALIGAMYMGNRLGGRFETAGGRMAAFAAPRRTVKLPTHVTALTWNKIVRTEQIEASRGVIKWFGLLGILPSRDAAPQQCNAQRNQQAGRTRSHYLGLKHRVNPAVSIRKIGSDYGTDRSWDQIRRCGYPGAHDRCHKL